MTPDTAIQTVATALDQVSGLRAPTAMPGSATPPTVITEIAAIRAPESFDGSVAYVMRCTLLVARSDQRNSQERTWALIDPTGSVSTSAFAALLSISAAGSVVFEGPGTVEYGGQQYAGGIFTVELFG